MAEKNYAEGSKPRKAELSDSEKVSKAIGDVGKGLAIGIGAALAGGALASAVDIRNSMRRNQNTSKSKSRFKVNRMDNL